MRLRLRDITVVRVLLVLVVFAICSSIRSPAIHTNTRRKQNYSLRVVPVTHVLSGSGTSAKVPLIDTPSYVHDAFDNDAPSQKDSDPTANGAPFINLAPPTDVSVGTAALVVAKEKPAPVVIAPSPPVKASIYVVNSLQTGFETVVPFLRALARQTDVDITLWFSNDGPTEVDIATLLAQDSQTYGLRLQNVAQMADEAAAPNVVLLTHCPEDMKKSKETLKTYLVSGARVYCVVQEAAKWDTRAEGKSPYKPEINFMMPWIQKGQWEFITLAPHVQKYVQEKFPLFLGTGNAVKYEASVVNPVFQLSDKDEVVDTEHPYAAMLLNDDPGRVDYGPTFASLGKTPPKTELHLLGATADVIVPTIVADRAKLIRDVDLAGRYQYTGKAFAALPAYATSDYSESRASSAVAMALSAGTPLIADKMMAAIYTAISVEALWMEEDGESVMDTFSRISEFGEEVWSLKKYIVAVLRDEMIQRNVEFFANALNSVAVASAQSKTASSPSSSSASTSESS
ncbi:uncharacterized protein V1518DRAFT_415281 [Limtongia smithiae]|uniref:uncharacterized protein n=1 Tax=Limtongia smithiae TaxID=1125753 RepID=UPI0034CEF231